MDSLVMAGQFLLGILILVFIHELGHFLAARMFGIRVEKFFLFFDVGGFKLFKFKRGETEYGFGWLPLGGYVKISGMIDESVDKTFINSEPKPYEFRSKPTWQRLIVMVAGIFMNVVLGILIFIWHTYHYGSDYIPASELNNGIIAHSLAKEVGFKTGDKIVALNGEKLNKASDIINTSLLLDKNVTYKVERNGEFKDITLDEKFAGKALNEGLDSFIELRQSFAVDSVLKHKGAAEAGLQKGDHIIAVDSIPTPFFKEFSEALSKKKTKDVTLKVVRGTDTISKQAHVDEDGKLGFIPKFNFETEKYDLATSISVGTNKAWHAITVNVKGIWRVIVGDLPAKKSLHGLIGIANAYGPVWVWRSFWLLTGILSMWLAFVNLLPIPALDGGHVLFLLVEMVRRKPLSYRFLEVAQMVGMALLFLLMGFALYNDFAEYIFKR